MHARMFLSAAFVLVLFTVVLQVELRVHARSSGMVSTTTTGQPSSCDLTPVNWPHKEHPQAQLWPNGFVGRNRSSPTPGIPDDGIQPGPMPWVNAPRPSSAYTLRSADGASSADPTSYISGVPLTLHLKVDDLKLRYIGLVLYASSNSIGLTPLDPSFQGVRENRVGTWKTMPNDEFQTPSTCPGAVSHTNANIKPLHTRFQWTGSKGTGTVRFRILIKQGEQNSGNFWYLSKDLILTEAAVPTTVPTSVTVTGAAGVACADVCNNNYPSSTKYCDAAAMLAISSTSALQSALRTVDAPFRFPLLAACAYAGAPQVAADGFASFRSSDINSYCPASYAAAQDLSQPDVCYTAPLSTSRAICVCTSDASKQTPNPFRNGGLNEGDDVLYEPTDVPLATSPSSSASARGPSLLALGLSLLVSAGVSVGARSSMSRRSTLSLLLVLVLAALCLLATPADAHNYIMTVHRARTASVSNPCQSRVGSDPHIQVVAGQEFELEWSSGHGDYTQGPFYFGILREADLMQLKRDGMPSVLDRYLKEAPDSAKLTGEHWERHHLHNPSECDLGSNPQEPRNCNSGLYFKEAALSPSDSSFIKRDQVSSSKAHPKRYENNDIVIQQRYQDKHLVNDKRAEYKHSDFPWLEGASAFYNVFPNHPTYNEQADIARFRIPARQGPGNYVVWFYWSGYMDCVDVNVRSGTTPVENRYGTINNDDSLRKSVITKLDHCEYTYVGYAATQCRKVDKSTMSVQQCIDDCRNRWDCNGVQVVRWKNAPGTLPATVNIPFTNWVYNQEALDKGGLGRGAACRYDPCMCQDVDSRVLNGCSVKSTTCTLSGNNALPSMADDDFVCYGAAVLRNEDFQVEEDYRVATEPRDPVWYGTCLTLSDPGGFLNIAPLQYSAPKWNQGDQCVSCDYQASMSSKALSVAPIWTDALASTCAQCDIRNSKASVSALPLSGANQPTAGAQPAYTFSWQLDSSWSACSCAGKQTKNARCISSNGNTQAPDSSCANVQKPATEQSCTAPATCFEWKLGTFGSCSSDCGGGTQTATATCVQSSSGAQPGATASSESLCTASAKPATSKQCNTQACSVAWKSSGFGSCSKTCDGGVQTQTVTCLMTQNGAQSAVADSYCANAGTKPATSQSCNTQICQDGTWSTPAFGTCSVSCGGGTQTRTVQCQSASGVAYSDGSRCASTKPATIQSCGTGACPTYSWTSGSFSACSAACGSGVQTRSVTCTASTGGTATDSQCSAAGTKPATSQTCSASTDCYEWKQSNVWGSCTTDCNGGTQTQTVNCVQTATAPQPGTVAANSQCKGTAPASSRSCNTGACPKAWKAGGFAACSAACGGGVQTQTVTCVQTQNGMQATVADSYCSSAGTKPASSQSCNTQTCQVWQWAYGNWGTCSASCGGGQQTRSRTCVDQAKMTGDSANCADASTQPTQQQCNTDACPTYSWRVDSWSSCSVGCGSGVQTASVTCLSSLGGQVADSYCANAGSKPASSKTCTMPTACYEWKVGSFSSCSVDCGSGTQSATVACVQTAAAPQPGATVADAQCSAAGSKPASTRSCGLGACPVEWKQSGLSACTVSCGGGLQTQTVTCVQTQNGAKSEVADSYCSSAGSKPITSQSCNTQVCNDGQLSYSTWSSCSKTCGSGVQTRSQQCISKDGKEVYTDNSRCAGQTAEATSRACNTDLCVEYEWRASSYGTCSTTCGGGAQTRRVVCADKADTAATPAAQNENYCTFTKPTSTQTCNTAACPPPPNYQWVSSSFSTCSASCAGGTQTRTVSCRNLADSPSSLQDDSKCADSKPVTVQSCAQQACPTYSWSAGMWSACSLPCTRPASGSPSGTQTRSVTCKQDGTSTTVADAQCTAAKLATTQTCNTQKCLEGNFAYSAWSACSASCAGGIQTRTEACVDAAGQKTDAQQCSSPDQVRLPTQQACNTQACPPYWWQGDFSACSTPCGGNGVRTRKVYCLPAGASDPNPPNAALLDSDCQTTKPETSQVCNTQACPQWQYAAGSSWGACSTPCGPGTQTRPTQCIRADKSLAPASECLTATPLSSERTCQTIPCPHWHRQSWSSCSKACADSVSAGVRTREVLCRMPHDDLTYAGSVAKNQSLCSESTGSTGDGEGEAGVANGKPPAQELCNVDPCPSYYWQHTNPSACSVSCGGGIQTTTVKCFSSKTQAEAPSTALCTATKPAPQLPCNTDVCPDYRWATGDLSACSARCGDGWQVRTVSCRNYKPDESIHFDFVDVEDTLCTSAPKPDTSVKCSQPESVCFGSEFASGGRPSGRCDSTTKQCVCSAGYTGPFCASKTPKITDVATSASSLGVALGEAVTITWKSDPLLVPTVTLLLRRASWPVGVYAYLGVSVGNNNRFTWLASVELLGPGMPLLESGDGYSITVWYQKEQLSASSALFAINDPCSYINCGTHGQCNGGKCACSGGWQGDRCTVAPCERARCDAKFSTCSSDLFAGQVADGVVTAASLPSCGPCTNGYGGMQCRSPPLCLRENGTPKCNNGGDLVDISFTSTFCDGTCSCMGNWTGSTCDECGLKMQCVNGAVPSGDCTSCQCVKGTFGPLCQYRFLRLTLQFLGTWSSSDSDNATAVLIHSHFSAGVSADLLTALQSVGQGRHVLLTVESVRPAPTDANKVQVTVLLSVESDSVQDDAPDSRRLLATSSDPLLSLWDDFRPLLSDRSSLVWQGPITSRMMDPAFAVRAADPSEANQQLQQADQPCDRIEDPQQCSAGSSSENGGSSSSGSGISSLLRKPLYLGLLIGGVVLLVALSAGAFFLQRHCRAKGKANLARLHADGNMELAGNPARPSQWSKATQWTNI